MSDSGSHQQSAGWVVRTATSLLARGGNLQSGVPAEALDEPALREGLRAHMEAEESRQAAEEGRPPSQQVAIAAADDVLREGRAALERASQGASATALSEHELDALQAIIQVVGRPALRYRDGHVELPASQVGENEYWHVFIATARKSIDRVSAAVGRVVYGRSEKIVGTGWRLGQDLIVTNRHVARYLVDSPDAPPTQWKLDASLVAVADFAATDDARERSHFRIAALEYCAVEDRMDIAVLRITSQGDPFPEGFSFEPSPAAESVRVGADVYVVGHPVNDKPTAVMKRIFGKIDGSKRCAPGRITAVAAGAPTLEHDCSTLGGNSGSCVIGRANHRVLGIHCGSRGGNEAAGTALANRAVDLTRLGEHRLADILVKGRV
jgi:hypothetical protein